MRVALINRTYVRLAPIVPRKIVAYLKLLADAFSEVQEMRRAARRQYPFLDV